MSTAAWKENGDVLITVLQAALALLFITSAVAKILDPTGTRTAVAGFGVPAKTAPLVAVGVPLLELLASGLLLTPFVRLGAGLSLALLLLFTGAVLNNLVRGRVIECRCFGGLGASDLSYRTILRNTLLMAAAVVVLLGPDPVNVTWWSLVLSTLLVGGLLGAEQLMHRQAAAREQEWTEREFVRAAALGQDDAAPDLQLQELGGQQVRLSELWARTPALLLIFTSPTCLPCRNVKALLGHWAGLYQGRLTIALLTTGAEADNAEAFNVPGLRVLLDNEREGRLAYGTASTPTGVLIKAGKTVSPPAVGEGLIRRLLPAALSSAAVDLSLPPSSDGVPASELDGPSRPVPRATVIADLKPEGLVLVDEASGAMLQLDAVGSTVWQLFDGRTVDSIAHALAHEYGAPLDVVRADVLEMCKEIGRLGLLAGVAAEWVDFDADDDSAAGLTAV